MKLSIKLVALLLLLTGCGNQENGESETNGTAAEGSPVYVQELQPSTFRHFISVQGNVESDRTIMVTPKTSAEVEEILVRAGDEVARGDVLARLDGDITRSQLQELQTQLDLAEDLFERQSNLREQNIGSEVEFLQARNQVESLENQLATLTEQFENYTIRASIAGTVNQVNLKVGESVGPNAPVFQLSNSDALKVTAEVSEAYINRVETTDSVEISFSSLKQTINQPLDVVSKVINPSNRTFAVEAYIPNLDGQIRPNMVAKLKINDITLTDQIVVPVNTIQQANESRFVYVAQETDEGWIATQKKVTTGENFGNELVIEEGLSAGDILITSGYEDLTEGEAISIKENN